MGHGSYIKKFTLLKRRKSNSEITSETPKMINSIPNTWKNVWCWVNTWVINLLIIAIPINSKSCEFHLCWKVVSFQQLKVVPFYLKISIYIERMWPFILKSCDSSYKYYYKKTQPFNSKDVTLQTNFWKSINSPMYMPSKGIIFTNQVKWWRKKN